MLKTIFIIASAEFLLSRLKTTHSYWKSSVQFINILFMGVVTTHLGT